MQITNLAEMMAVDRKGDCKWQQPGATKKCPQEKPPILQSLSAKNAQAYIGAKERKETLKIQLDFNLRRLILSKERPDTLIVVLARINMAHYVLIAVIQ